MRAIRVPRLRWLVGHELFSFAYLNRFDMVTLSIKHLSVTFVQLGGQNPWFSWPHLYLDPIQIFNIFRALRRLSFDGEDASIQPAGCPWASVPLAHRKAIVVNGPYLREGLQYCFLPFPLDRSRLYKSQITHYGLCIYCTICIYHDRRL